MYAQWEDATDICLIPEIEGCSCDDNEDYVKAQCRREYSSAVQSVGDYGDHNGNPKTLEECKELCDANAECLSFVVDQNGGNKCHLKNECVDLSASCVDGGGWDFINYYPSRTCSGTHMIAMGKHSHNDWTDDHPTSICTDDSSHSAAYSNDYFGYDIAVRCCYEDDLGDVHGDSPDCSAHPKTLDEAAALCVSHGMRLCTEDEILDEVTGGTGCQYDRAYIWTSTEC